MFFFVAARVYSSTLNIDTDYRLRGISYDHDPTVFASTAAVHSLSYSSQRLMLSLTGDFDKGIEIGAKLTSLGVVGTTSTLSNVPFSKTDFSPFVENAYVKFKNFADWPLDIIAGRQTLGYGSGLIIDDNGTGFDAIRLMTRFNCPIPFSHYKIPLNFEYFTAKVKETIARNSDADVFGGVLSTNLGKNLLEIGYFEETDFSGTAYVKAPNDADAFTNTWATKAIDKRFLDFRLGEKEKISEYQLEMAQESGYITRNDGTQINLSGSGYLLSGKLVNENTKIGKVAARALVSYASGSSYNPGSFADDTSFSPTYTKKYDGLERAGYGTIFGAVPGDSFVLVPAGYSGVDTLNIGVDIAPLYDLIFALDYFSFSASEAQKGAPDASGFERFYGANFSMGSELDLSARFINSKYSSVSLAYCTYVPPQGSAIWPNSTSIVSLRFEITAKF